MKTNLFKMVLILLSVPLISCQEQSPGTGEPDRAADISDFTGHWSFDIDGGWVGWLGVSHDEFLDAELLWKWGSVLPVANIFLAGDGVLHVTRTVTRRRSVADSEEPRIHTVTNWMEATTDGESISGYFLEPRADGMGVDSTWFEGERLPEVPPAPDLNALEYAEPVELFNGRDLSGWRLVNENQVNGFRAEDGVLVNETPQKPGEPRVRYGNLRTIDEFEDFNLTLDVNVPAGSNSGVYLRGMYEIQILDSYGREPGDHNMGALYSRITPSSAAERPAGEWQSMDITLADRHLTVILNGETIIDSQPVYGPTGGALQSDVSAPGPIYLQGDHGPVSFRNMVLTPIKN